MPLHDIPLTFDYVFTLGAGFSFLGVYTKEIWWIFGGVLIIAMGIMFLDADDKRREAEIQAQKEEFWID